MTHIVCCRFTLLVCGLMLGAAAATAAESSPVELARLIANDQAAAGDRIAAMVNLQAQAKKIAADKQAAEAVAPAVWSVIAKPPAGDPKAVAWLVSRGLELLSALPATPEMVTTVAGIVADPSRDLDLRIRAAVALGALAPTTPLAEPADTLGAIRGLAIAALQSELDAAARRRLVTEFSMGSLALPKPAFDKRVSAGVPAARAWEPRTSTACPRQNAAARPGGWPNSPTRSPLPRVQPG